MPPYTGNIWADMIDEERERQEELRREAEELEEENDS